ncbi:MAG: repeat protein [Labilithrix sp.]|nr:repeat protein [Labilithrix sp.]
MVSPCDHYHVTRRLGATSRGRAGRLVLAAVAALVIGGCVRPGPVERAQQLVRMHRETEAVTLLRGELARHPQDVPSRRLLVRVLAYQGQLDEARAEVAELERRLPGDPVPWIELGHAFELTHRYDEALAAYDTGAEKASASPLGPREGGMRAARWGEAEAALPRLEEAVRRGAHDAELLHALGLVRLHLHDLDGARQAYEQGLAADPKSTENLLGLASVAVVRGDPAGALSAYDRILAQRPAYSGAELGRAWALLRLGRRAEAEQALAHAGALGASRENIARLRADSAKMPGHEP